MPYLLKSATFYINAFCILATLGTCTLLQSCSNTKNVYVSDCDGDQSFKRVSFTQLMDSLSYYDKKFVEVSGQYQEGKEESVLVNDSLMADHSIKNALWVDFSPDCPLYLTGTREGLFEYNDGQFTRINGKTVTLHGRIDLNKGKQKKYKATISRLSLVKL